MRAAFVLASLLLLLLASLPAVEAQQPVDKCSRQCTPTATDVNDPATRRNEPVNVILYPHFENILQQAPMNTVPPDPLREPDVNRGFLMPVVETNAGICPAGVCTDFHYKNNEFTAYFCPGVITFLDKGWQLGCHSGRLGADLQLANRKLTLYWYLSAHAIPQENSNSTTGRLLAVGAMPRVGVEAQLVLREYASAPSGQKPWKDAPFATGDTGPNTNLITLPGRPDVYEFRIDLVSQRDTIPSNPSGDTKRVVLRVVPYQVRTSDMDGNHFMQDEWRLRTGARFPPRLIVPLANPLQLESGALVRDAETGNTTFVAKILAPLGSYDVDVPTIGLNVTGPAGVPADAVELFQVKRSVDHDGTGKPAIATWRIHLDRFGDAGGTYRFQITARNLQGTYELQESVGYDITQFTGQATVPGPGAALTLLGLAGLGLVGARRARKT